MQCPICEQSIDADETAFQHHVNNCLDGGSDSTTCPSCSKSFGNHLALFTDQERSDHVSACLTSNDASHQYPSICPTCHRNLSPNEDLEAHLLACLMQQEEEQSLIDVSALAPKAIVDSAFTLAKEAGSTTSLDKPVQTRADLFPVILALLERRHEAGSSQSSILCRPSVLHITVQWGEDMGWGCGYRCFQMLYSAMRHVPVYEDLLRELGSGDRIPTVLELQQLLEAAWIQGYDPTGAEHFDSRIAGRRKWIGTTELYTVFTYLGIRTQIVDFPKEKGHLDLHRDLLRWTVDYFRHGSEAKKGDVLSRMMATNGSACIVTDKQPLFLQHQGHSRVVIGIEEGKGDPCLLVFDPNIKSKPATIKAAEGFADHDLLLDRDNAAATLEMNRKGFEDDNEPPKKRAKVASDKPLRRVGAWLKTLKSGQPLKLEDHSTLLSVYRLSFAKLSRNEEYQILHIITDQPALTAQEKISRRIPQSIKGTSH